MQYGTYVLGMLLAALISLSYVPKLQKAMLRNSTSDLSLKMLVHSAVYASGLSYGVLRAIGCSPIRSAQHSRSLARAWLQNSRLEFLIW
jgi:uncharacterized protein with PQ loop repeat